MIWPDINLNGTSEEELVEQADRVFVDLMAAKRHLGLMNPHGRDYMDPRKFLSASNQWADWHQRLDKLVEEIQQYRNGMPLDTRELFNDTP